MNTRLAAVAAALVLSVAAPVTSFAQNAHVHGQTSWQVRTVDSSAKEGNASQPERAFPQYGNTSGGPAY